MQSELRLMGKISCEIISVDMNLVRRCKTEQDAFRLCVQFDPVRRSHRDLAELMNMSPGGFNSVLNGDSGKRVRYMSRVQQIRLQQLCCNRAIDQWAELYAQGLLDCQRTAAQRIVEAQEALIQAQIDYEKLSQNG